ncbi:site-2 protease family protein [Sungkyunkwania multivorans]|uniref:Zinc metalloprotease n=1 Tax=Sungkyunkwania multivorans TaxID=1173618 RepID=A0ABW3D3W2_9FLAO
MKGILKLGTISGIRIEVHWTFIFLIVWVIYIEVKRGGSFESAMIHMAFILVLFACVVLHELGHALMARRYGIATQKITLLPIGGVASLEKMPKEPREELLVAIAGPLVNVGIALLLLIVVPWQQYVQLNAEELEQMFSTISLQNFLFYLLVANLILVVFNLIPAFPMDGGRVLRAILAMGMNRRRATSIAAGLGQLLAIGFFVFGIFFNPFLILIALFIFLGAAGENQMEQQLSLLEGYTIKDAMLTNITKLSPSTQIKEVVELLIAGTERDFVVVDDQDELLGVLLHGEIVKNVKNHNLPIDSIMNKDLTVLEANTPLKEALSAMALEKKKFFPVIENNHLAGAIDQTNLSEFILLRSQLLNT